MRRFGRGWALVTTLFFCGSAHAGDAPKELIAACRQLWAETFSSPRFREARAQLDVLTRRDHSLKELEPILRNLESLPEADRLRLAAKAGSYKNLKSQLAVFAFAEPSSAPGFVKKKKGARFSLKDGIPVAPRRSIDLALRALLQPEEHFAAQLAAGRAPLEAWRHTLAYWRPQNVGEHSAYDVDAVVAVARDLQRAWKQSSTPPGPRDVIHLSGSFPNGRARFPQSDVDLRPILPDSHEIDHGEIQKALQQSFAKRLPGIARPHMQFPPISVERMGFTSPFMVRIGPEKIELLVWPRPTFPWSDVSGVRHPQLPAPLVYPLE